MARAARGGFAFISWKVYQKDIIARNFVDKFGNKMVYQVLAPCAAKLVQCNVAVSGKRGFQHTIQPGMGFSIRQPFETKI